MLIIDCHEKKKEILEEMHKIVILSFEALSY